MYNQIASNKRKTIILIFLFTVVILLLGWFLGFQFNNPNAGIIFAVIIATAMSLFSYFGGDKVALVANGAKQIHKADAPEIWRLVENLSITAGNPMPKIYIIDDPAPNAFATGRKPETASIAMTTGLLKIMNKQELEGVISHELSHIKNYDILVMTIVIVLVGVVMLLADILLRSFIFGGRKKKESNQITLILFLVGLGLSILSPLLAELIKLAVSRSREYMADASGALLTRYPEGLASALEKLKQHGKPMKKANHATAHLFISSPFAGKKSWLSGVFSTHPPIDERIKKLRAMT